MTMNELIMKAREKKCSDIHISEGMPVSFRIHGQLLDSGFSFPAAETREMILSMLSDEQREQLENGEYRYPRMAFFPRQEKTDIEKED